MVVAWHGCGMARVNQTWPHCVNQMGKTQSKPLAAWHGMGAAWERHGVCELAFTVLLTPNYTLQTYSNSADYKTKSSIYYTNYYINDSDFLYYNQHIKQETVEL
jgi:hypothetical protein